MKLILVFATLAVCVYGAQAAIEDLKIPKDWCKYVFADLDHHCHKKCLYKKAISYYQYEFCVYHCKIGKYTFSHPYYCDKFVYCIGPLSTAIPRPCPKPLHFNNKIGVCDWKRNAGCANPYYYFHKYYKYYPDQKPTEAPSTKEKDTTPQPTLAETTETPKVKDTTPQPTQEETTETPKVKDTTPQPTQEETTETPKVKDTTPQPTQEETTETPKTKETTELPKVSTEPAIPNKCVNFLKHQSWRCRYYYYRRRGCCVYYKHH